MKRALVTAGLSAINPEVLARLTGTRLDTLRGHYQKHDMTAKVEGVIALGDERSRRREARG